MVEIKIALVATSSSLPRINQGSERSIYRTVYISRTSNSELNLVTWPFFLVVSWRLWCLWIDIYPISFSIRIFVVYYKLEIAVI